MKNLLVHKFEVLENEILTEYIEFLPTHNLTTTNQFVVVRFEPRFEKIYF